MPFIKKFKADDDRLQFYNFIIWVNEAIPIELD